ncbi:MAG: hypothetical protein B7X46_03215 [Thiomonas sp. 15-66-11]|nr:MAG: hypothetical protein B7X46_03215 [Thiomonas sp. 15-66-11]
MLLRRLAVANERVCALSNWAPEFDTNFANPLVFRRLKGLRRVFSRFEKLDAMFLGFLSFVLVVDGLRNLC